MSFTATVPQIEYRMKTVTRRLAWKFIKPGDQLWAVNRSPRIKSDKSVRRLALIEVVSVRREPLFYLALNENDVDVAREGFPEIDSLEFVELFCRINKCSGGVMVTRIEFRYLDQGSPFERLRISTGPVRLAWRMWLHRTLVPFLDWISRRLR